jgi:hypothetical protein
VCPVVSDEVIPLITVVEGMTPVPHLFCTEEAEIHKRNGNAAASVQAGTDNFLGPFIFQMLALFSAAPLDHLGTLPVFDQVRLANGAALNDLEDVPMAACNADASLKGSAHGAGKRRVFIRESSQCEALYKSSKCMRDEGNGRFTPCEAFDSISCRRSVTFAWIAASFGMI